MYVRTQNQVLLSKPTPVLFKKGQFCLEIYFDYNVLWITNMDKKQSHISNWYDHIITIWWTVEGNQHRQKDNIENGWRKALTSRCGRTPSATALPTEAVCCPTQFHLHYMDFVTIRSELKIFNFWNSERERGLRQRTSSLLNTSSHLSAWRASL